MSTYVVDVCTNVTEPNKFDIRMYVPAKFENSPYVLNRPLMCGLDIIHNYYFFPRIQLMIPQNKNVGQLV